MAAHRLVEHADAIAETDPGVQLQQRRSAGGAGVAVRDPGGHRLLQREDVVELRVLVRRIQEPLFDRARISEHPIEPIGPELFDQLEFSGS